MPDVFEPTAVDWVKYAYSTVLCVFSYVIVVSLIFTGNTRVAQDVSPVLAFILLTFAIIWLGMIEGGQGALVGLPPVAKELYVDSHPITHMNTLLAHKGDNLDRYLLGRQFLVLLVVFTVNNCGAPLDVTQPVLGLPQWIINLFLGTGLAMILFATNVGQLMSQVNASHCMLDFINNYFALFTLLVCMAIEGSGLLHSSYLIQYIFAALSGQPIQSQEEPRTPLQDLFFWARVFISLAILCFAFAVTLQALFQGNTTMWEGVPNIVSVILFFFFMSIVGMLEGMQIAFFAVVKLPMEERGKSKLAKMTANLVYHGKNLPGFMVGRQICVTLCFFIIARVTTITVGPEDPNIFGVSDGLQNFFNTGLLGALITTIVASITWQLVASAFPVAFMGLLPTYILLRWCLFLEATGICAASWFFAMIHKKIAGFQVDEVYIGTPEERAAREKVILSLADKEENLHVGAGHMVAPKGWELTDRADRAMSDKGSVADSDVADA